MPLPDAEWDLPIIPPPPRPWPRQAAPPVRFLVFSGLEYYAAGGWGDFKAGFANEDTALAAADEINPEHWVQVVDLQTWKIIYRRFEAYGTPTSNTVGA